MARRPFIAVCILPSVLALSTVAVSAEGPRFEKPFDNSDALEGLTVSGDVSINTSKDRGGPKGLEAADVAPADQEKSGTLRLGPGGKAVWPVREDDGTGVLELWVCEDATKPANPRDYGAGAMWGLMRADGHMAAVGAICAPHLDGAETYAVAPLAARRDVL